MVLRLAADTDPVDCSRVPTSSVPARLHRLPPPAWVALSFAALIAAGTLLLKLPWATPPEAPIGWVDALFTSTSASCITGLVVRDTGAGFTLFGQVVILGLAQIGGLGVMTLALFFVIAGGRISLDQRSLVEETLTGGHSLAPRELIRLVLAFTVVCEAVGALWLWLAFRGELERPAWQALFHAISAFTNAGFTLLPDSLARFRGDVAVNLAVMALILLGGLGFLAVYDLRRTGLRWRRLTLHTRVVVLASALLVTVGALGFWLVERRHSLGELPASEQLLASLFQSVTTRSGGLTTLDIAALAPATLLGMIVLMFVGGSPGSCAGGIKTTTAATMLVALRAQLSGRRNVNVLGRTLSRRTVTLAFVATTSALTAANAGLFALLLVETPAADGAGFADYAFEAMSALGTVGLSTGVTPTLEPTSKLVLALLMFLGRVGPLTLAAIAAGDRADDWQHPSETIMIG